MITIKGTHGVITPEDITGWIPWEKSLPRWGATLSIIITALRDGTLIVPRAGDLQLNSEAAYTAMFLAGINLRRRDARQIYDFRKQVRMAAELEKILRRWEEE